MINSAPSLLYVTLPAVAFQLVLDEPPVVKSLENDAEFNPRLGEHVVFLVGSQAEKVWAKPRGTRDDAM